MSEPSRPAEPAKGWWGFCEDAFLSTPSNSFKKYAGYFDEGVRKYPISVMTTAIFFTWLGLNVSKYGFNMVRYPCIRRHGHTAVKMTLQAGLCWLVKIGLDSAAAEHKKGTAKGSPRKGKKDK